MTPKLQAPIPKSLAGGSLITKIIVNKYQYHLPLYRQSKMLASYNVLIPDNFMKHVGKLLHNLIIYRQTKIRLIFADIFKLR